MSAVADSGWSSWPAPAKLNLFLRITGRRADGYHELQTVFRLLDWGDTVELRPRADGRVHRLGDSAAGVAEQDDLMVRAANLLKSSANVVQGVDIRVEKRIPSGGGFGGGSSDAATVLVALDRLWGTGLSTATLAGLGLRLGADVPVFVHGHNAWAEGVGERLTPLALPPATYLLVDAGVHAPTAALFQAPDLTRDAPAAKISDFVSGSLLDNAFELVLRRREPVIDRVLTALSRVGRARLTGSGGGCFVEFGDRASAEAALARLDGLPPGARAWLAAGAARSPLLEASGTENNPGASPSG